MSLEGLGLSITLPSIGKLAQQNSPWYSSLLPMFWRDKLRKYCDSVNRLTIVLVVLVNTDAVEYPKDSLGILEERRTYSIRYISSYDDIRIVGSGNVKWTPNDFGSFSSSIYKGMWMYRTTYPVSEQVGNKINPKIWIRGFSWPVEIIIKFYL